MPAQGVMGNRGMEIEIAMSVGNGRIGTTNLSKTDITKIGEYYRTIIMLNIGQSKFGVA